MNFIIDVFLKTSQSIIFSNIFIFVDESNYMKCYIKGDNYSPFFPLSTPEYETSARKEPQKQNTITQHIKWSFPLRDFSSK